MAAHDDGLAFIPLGAQRFAEAGLVLGDEARGRAQDIRRRAVVLFQPDHLCPGEVFLEAQDVVHLGAAPAIDRLVVIADAADVEAGDAPPPAGAARDTGRRWCPDTRRPGCSGSVADRYLRTALGMFLKEAQHFQQQVAEVTSVHHLEPLLVVGIEPAAVAIGKAVRFTTAARGPASARGSSNHRSGPAS